MIPYMRVASAMQGHDRQRRRKLLSFLLPGQRSLRPGPLGHAVDRLPLHAVAARLGFAQRFDRAASRLAGAGGGAVSPQQALAYFGPRLFFSADPKSLTHRLDEKFLDGDERRWIGRHFLDAGDWRNILSHVEGSPVHREIIEVCQTRAAFRDGPQYARHAEMIRRGRPPRRGGKPLDTVDKLDAYFRYCLELVENIDRTGILPRGRFQRSNDTGHRHRSIRSIWQDLVERDIGVAICADGRLVRHTSGKHRLAAAVGLGLDYVPVEIRMVHLHWLQAQMQRLDLPPAAALATALEEKSFG